MKVILYTYDLNIIGGIETSFYQLAQHLKSKGYDVSVRYSTADPIQIKRFSNAGINISRIKQETCDILIIGSIYSNNKLITAKVTVQQVHADYTDKFWNGAGDALRLLAKNKDIIDIYAPVSISSSVFVKKAVKKHVIVMNNIAPKKDNVRRVKHSGLNFGAFTRMTKEKGLKNYQLFRKQIEKLGIKAKFYVYTNGEAPDGWIKKEPVVDIKTELGKIDFVVSLADTESFGYTIAEANSVGIPCVIKRANSTGEFFADDNLILDSNLNFNENDLSRTIKTYDLRLYTEQSVDKAMKTFEKLTVNKCIIRSMRRFYDLDAGVTRYKGEIFTVNKKRADELLNNKLRLVERI